MLLFIHRPEPGSALTHLAPSDSRLPRPIEASCKSSAAPPSPLPTFAHTSPGQLERRRAACVTL